MNNGNLDTNETVFFKFNNIVGDSAFVGDQSSVTIGIGKGGNAANESFSITIWNDAHTVSATETITQADGTPIVVDATHWTGALPFFSFGEIDVTNIGGNAGFTTSDPKVLITTLSGGETIGSTTLTFAPTITDFDGDTATAATNLSVSLVGTANASGGYDLTGTTAPEVLVASAGHDNIVGGTGPGDTVDYSNSATAVTVDLSSETDAIAAVVNGGASGDVIKGVENIIGSAFADTLTAFSTGSVLVGGGGADTLVWRYRQ